LTFKEAKIENEAITDTEFLFQIKLDVMDGSNELCILPSLAYVNEEKALDCFSASRFAIELRGQFTTRVR